MTNKLKIVFMGTPDFAVGILDSILKNNYNIVAVITAPDKPAGRGQKLKFSAVKDYALANNLTILQPTNLKDPDFVTTLKDLKANLQIVVAFRMLPEIVWKMPQFGTFNLHASILPNYRGAAPINWAIINGDKKTGVTTFFIDEKIDTGAIILCDETTISDHETAEELHDKLMKLGTKTVAETLQLIENQTIKTTMQPESIELRTAHKLNKENCKVDWNKSGTTIHNLIRGLSPYPAAWTYLTDDFQTISLKIYACTFEPNTHDFKSGLVIIENKSIKIAVEDGYIIIDNLQLPGKRKMSAKELLNGTIFGPNAYLH